MTLQSINPATGEILAELAKHSADEIEARLARAAAAAHTWRFTPVAERCEVVARLGDLLDAEQQRLGRLMTLEMGKPIRAGAEEAAKCAVACRHYAAHGASMVADQPVADDEHRSYIAYDPLGVVLAVMPWNFPFWQVIRFLAPALVAGNVGLLKHASNVPQCALELETLVRRAGAPDGVFQTLLVDSSAVADIIADPRIAAVTLTGSERAGSSVAETAGRALKPSVLELGGSDPFIVMPSANLPLAIETAVKARTINNGQSCIAAKRFIVHRDVAERFTAGLVAGMEALRVGDPLDPRTQLGPLASARLATELEEQVRQSIILGARALCGGSREEPKSAWFPATVLIDIPENAPAYRDELFGPVACVFVARDAGDAIRIANSTRFGLASSVWTNDDAERDRFIREIDAGSVFVNDMVVSDLRFPFGGVKSSGYGRELSELGLREFTNIKTVRMRIAGGARDVATE
ncbi:MAG TPA: NAD-dependent succinate-semialdehyde dehydrogenase [Gemmatimonadaceae bacterium]